MRFSLVVASCALSGFEVGAHAYTQGNERFTRVRNARDIRSSYDYIIVGGGTAGLALDRLGWMREGEERRGWDFDGFYHN